MDRPHRITSRRSFLMAGSIRWDFDTELINSKVNSYSPPTEVGGMPWSISLYKTEDESHLAVFLARMDGDYELETVDVAASLSLINHNHESKTVVKDMDETFNNDKDCDWGIPQFIKWKTVVDESKGFIKNDKITVHVEFTLSNVIGYRNFGGVAFDAWFESHKDLREHYAYMGNDARDYIRQNFYTPMNNKKKAQWLVIGEQNTTVFDPSSRSSSVPSRYSLNGSVEPARPSTSRSITPLLADVDGAREKSAHKTVPMSCQKMPSDPRKARRASSVRSQSSNSQTPARPIKGHSSDFLHPVDLRHRLKDHARGLPNMDFTLPTTFYTRDALAESAIVRGIDHDVFAHFIKGAGRLPDRMSRMAEAKLHMLKQGLAAELDNPDQPYQLADAVWREVLAGRKDFLTAVRQARNKEEAGPRRKKDSAFAHPSSSLISIVPLAKPVPLETPTKNSLARSRTLDVVRNTPRPVLAVAPLVAVPTAVHSAPLPAKPLVAKTPTAPPPTAPISIVSVKPPAVAPLHNIISVKPADASLLPPKSPVQKESAGVTQKKASLESLVIKIGHTKRDDSGDSTDSTPSSSQSLPLSAESSSNWNEHESSASLEERKNKRKSSDPTKILADDEQQLQPKPTGKGGKRKKKGARKPPPKRTKLSNSFLDESIDSSEEPHAQPLEATTIDEDDGLPPRIVVEGQEPGTELEWDEEEIIVLRAGEKPEQRPPRLKRKQCPQEAEIDEAIPVDGETTAMDDTVRKEAEEQLAAQISIDASQSSDDTEDDSVFLYDPSKLPEQEDLTSLLGDVDDDDDPSLLPIIGFSRLPQQSTLPTGDTTGVSPTTTDVTQVLSTMAEAISEMVPVVKRESLESNSSLDSTGGGGRAKRAIRTRTRFSPSPEDGSPTGRAHSQTESNGVSMNKQISPI